MFEINLKSGMKRYLMNKNILWIPMVSMRYKFKEEGGKTIYNLNCDGNISRMLAILESSNIKHANVLIPDNTICYPNVSNNIHFLETTFKNNPAEVRMDTELVANLKYFNLDSYDVIVFEPNIIGASPLINKENSLYLCAVSKLNENSPEFITKPMDMLDHQIINDKKIKTFVCSQNQVEYFGRDKVELEQRFIQPKRNIIFLPFRQSDPGYKMKEIFDVLSKIDLNDYEVLYTAPNGVILDNAIGELISTDKETYLNILAQKPIIPYLEDVDSIMHATILEFLRFECRVLYYKNSLFRHKDGVGEIKEDLKTELTKMIGE